MSGNDVIIEFILCHGLVEIHRIGFAGSPCHRSKLIEQCTGFDIITLVVKIKCLGKLEIHIVTFNHFFDTVSRKK